MRPHACLQRDKWKKKGKESRKEKEKNGGEGALDNRTSKAWVLSQGCHITPRQRLLVRDGGAVIQRDRVSLRQ